MVICTQHTIDIELPQVIHQLDKSLQCHNILLSTSEWGQLAGFFRSEIGLRQIRALFPYPFIISMNVLSNLRENRLRNDTLVTNLLPTL